MVNKRVEFQKSAISLTVIFLALIIGFVVFNGAFNFMNIGVEKYNKTLTNGSEQTFDTLQANQDSLNTTIGQIRDSVGNITTDTTATQFFWNSFKGVGAALILPLQVINVGVSSATVLVFGTELVPVWVQTLIVMAIIIVMALVVLAVIAGGNSNV